MEETQLLFVVILWVIGAGFCSSQDKEAYKAEVAAREGEAARLKEAFEGELTHKVLEAKTIIQNHIKGEQAPCLEKRSEENGDGPGCNVMPFSQKMVSNTTTSSESKQNQNLIVFVSFSMPEASLKALFEALDKNPDVKLVMRGLVDDSMDKTARKINELGGVLEINPELFDRYQITHVPTFVLVNGDKPALKLAGNVTLSYARDIFNNHISQEQVNEEETS